MKSWPLILLFFIALQRPTTAQYYLQINDPILDNYGDESDSRRIEDTIVFYKNAKNLLFRYFDTHYDFNIDTCIEPGVLLFKFNSFEFCSSKREKKRLERERIKYFFSFSFRIHKYVSYDVVFLLNDSLRVIETPVGLKEGAKKIWSTIDFNTAKSIAKRYNDTLYDSVSNQRSSISYNATSRTFKYSIASSKSTLIERTSGGGKKYKNPYILIDATTGKVLEQGYFYYHALSPGGIRWL